MGLREAAPDIKRIDRGEAPGGQGAYFQKSRAPALQFVEVFRIVELKGGIAHNPYGNR